MANSLKNAANQIRRDVKDSANQMFSAIGAIQTLVEEFPLKFSLNKINFSTSFDVLAVLFKILGVDKDEIIEIVTDALCGDTKDYENANGFISTVEEIVKMALEANIINILNCSTNPIISNNLLDMYAKIGTDNSVAETGEGIVVNVAEIDFTGYLNKNPFFINERNFYFDVDNYNASTIWKSKDFNAYLWYIINKSDKSQKEQLIWDNRYRAKIYGEGNGKKKEIIKCTYIDEEYPKSDCIRIQICGGRQDENNLNKVVPANYYKTRKLGKNLNENWALNKTILEFNHDFLTSIKLYDPKIIVAEITDFLMGTSTNFGLKLGLSLNEEIIEGKIQQIIKNAITNVDMEVDDCYYSFSNEEYNLMLEEAERNRFNIINDGTNKFEVNTQDILNQLSGITSTSTLNEDKSIITKTLTDVIATPAQSGSYSASYGLDVDLDWAFNLMGGLVYPFVRQIFSPKVMFLLMVNKQIMGSIDDKIVIDPNQIINHLLNVIIKDIVNRLKDLLIDLFLSYVLKKLKPLLALFASKLLLETLKMYTDLLKLILNCVTIYDFSGLFDTLRNRYGVDLIDNVNYADIITPEQVKPGQSIC